MKRQITCIKTTQINREISKQTKKVIIHTFTRIYININPDKNDSIHDKNTS